MSRPFVSRFHLAGTLLALLMLLVLSSSCSKDGGPVAPNGGGSGGSRGPGGLGGEFSSGLANVPSEAVVTMMPGASLTAFMNEHNLQLITTQPIPAVGAFASEMYYLVRDRDNDAIDFTSFSFDMRLKSYSVHNRVWIPEDDRGGLSFDDDHGWRTGGEYASQPAIAQVHIPEARLITEGAGEIIAILDTGIDATHPLFTSNNATITNGANYTVFPPVAGVTESSRNGVDEDGDGYADDGVGHGTHVAGIVLTGARRATLRIYKVLDGEGRGTVFGLAKAIKAATDYGVQVINLSVGLHADDTMLHHVLEYSAAHGVAVVASAGNLDSNTPQYPAAYDIVFSVTAVDAQDVKASFANYGATVDIAAPGVDIISAIPSTYGTGKYAIASGCSMATPFVSAAIACVDARYGTGMTPVEAGNQVMTITDDINPMNPGYINQLGGRVNYQLALPLEP